MNTKINGSLPRAAILACLFALATLFSPAVLAAKPALITPALSFSNETQTTIDVTVTAGTPYGAPYGFSLQWMTLDDYLAHGFSSTLPFGCEASFAGEASGSRYKLAAGQSVTVTVGDFTVDNGFSTICQGPLVCGTTYVFRVFAHGGSAYALSPKSDPLAAQDTTAPCTKSGTCTLSHGYWENHPNDWPVTSLTLGNVLYSETQLLAILHASVGGNGLISLAHQVIAAKLSIDAGSDPTPIVGVIPAADALIGPLVVPPIGGGYLAPSVTGTLTSALDDWITANDCSDDDSTD
jgi:hypothetical protein